MKSAVKKEEWQKNQTNFENTEGETEQKCLVSPSFLRLWEILRGLSSSSVVVFVIEMEVQFLKL